MQRFLKNNKVAAEAVAVGTSDRGREEGAAALDIDINGGPGRAGELRPRYCRVLTEPTVSKFLAGQGP